MAAGIRFKVWQGKGGFFAHMIAGNSRIVWQTEAYVRKGAAFNACSKTWQHIAAAIDPGHVLQWPGVPYTRDSLTPMLS